uniref:GRF-type domain-containing protein n=1 Tax=Hordeum vulgare subsp. vulgare TaxID=112509 RepID=A0A8I6YYY3_HORVV
MSSLSVGSAASRGIRRRGAAARSPVAYREQPMDYEPAIYCRRCGRKAPRWISWSEANPGRRYYACVEAQHEFVQWHDGPTSAFLRVLLGDLRDRVWMLENEVAAMCIDEDAGAGVCVQVQKRNEQTSSTGYSLARKGLMLVCGIVILVSGLVLGMLLS